jgi:hypothetical protein
MTRCVEPAAIFFDKTDAMSWPSVFERTLDTNEDVIGWAQLHRAAPHHASPLAFDHAPDRRSVELDGRHARTSGLLK